MEENKGLDKAPASITDKFKMEPPAGAWNALDADLERLSAAHYRKKANRFRLLSIGLAILLISFITFYYIGSPNQSKNSSVVSDKSSPVENKNVSIPENHAQPMDKGTVTNNSKVNEKVQPPEKMVTTESSSAQNSKTEPTVSTAQQKRTSPAVTQEKTLADNKINPKANKSNEANTINKTPASNHTIADKAVQNTSSDINRDNATGNDNLQGKESSSPDVQAAVATAPQPQLNENKNSAVDSTRSDMGASYSSASPSSPSIAVVDAKADQPVAASTIAVKDSAMTKDSVSHVISRWSLSAFYAPHYSRNRLTDNNSYDAENPSDYYANEKSSYSFATGLLLHYHLNERWSIATGAAYSTLAYSITIPTVYAETGSDNKVHYQYPTSCGTIIMPNASGKYIHNGDTLQVNAGCDQILKFIKVPLLARFQIPLNSLTIYAEAGASVNFLLEERAVVRVGNTETTIINNIEGLKKTSYSYLLGIGIEYRVHKNIGVFMEPVYSAALNSMTENISMNCYPYSFGLNTGVSFHF